MGETVEKWLFQDEELFKVTNDPHCSTAINYVVSRSAYVVWWRYISSATLGALGTTHTYEQKTRLRGLDLRFDQSQCIAASEITCVRGKPHRDTRGIILVSLGGFLSWSPG